FHLGHGRHSFRRNVWSGRVDLNHRSPASKAGALARLSYALMKLDLTTGLEPASVRIRSAVLVRLSYVRIGTPCRIRTDATRSEKPGSWPASPTARDWLPGRDSNPHSPVNSRLSCRWTTWKEIGGDSR